MIVVDSRTCFIWVREYQFFSSFPLCVCVMHWQLFLLKCHYFLHSCGNNKNHLIYSGKVNYSTAYWPTLRIWSSLSFSECHHETVGILGYSHWFHLLRNHYLPSGKGTLWVRKKTCTYTYLSLVSSSNNWRSHGSVSSSQDFHSSNDLNWPLDMLLLDAGKHWWFFALECCYFNIFCLS